MRYGESLGESDELPAVAPSLAILVNSHSPEGRQWRSQVNSDNPDHLTTVNQDIGIITRAMVVGVICVIRFQSPAELKQNMAADRVIRGPVLRRGW